MASKAKEEEVSKEGEAEVEVEDLLLMVDKVEVEDLLLMVRGVKVVVQWVVDQDPTIQVQQHLVYTSPVHGCLMHLMEITLMLLNKKLAHLIFAFLMLLLLEVSTTTRGLRASRKIGPHQKLTLLGYAWMKKCA